MTRRSEEERWWKAMADLADEGMAPLELTDRRILRASREATNALSPSRKGHWMPLAVAASLGIIGIGVTFHQPSNMDDRARVLPAEAETHSDAPVLIHDGATLDFALGSAVLLPRAEADLEALASRGDLCAQDRRMTVAAGGTALLAAERARSVARRMAELVGARCTPDLRSVSGPIGADQARISIDIE